MKREQTAGRGAGGLGARRGVSLGCCPGRWGVVGRPEINDFEHYNGSGSHEPITMICTNALKTTQQPFLPVQYTLIHFSRLQSIFCMLYIHVWV